MEYTVKPSGAIHRDFIYRTQGLILTEEVDLRPFASPVKDQGDLGACVPSAVTSAYELLTNKQLPNQYTDLSTLFLYYNARLIEELHEIVERMFDMCCDHKPLSMENYVAIVTPEETPAA